MAQPWPCMWRVRCRTLCHGAIRCCAQLGAPIRFCETNPFCFVAFFDVSLLFTEAYAVCSSVYKWVRSSKTNPFWRGFWRPGDRFMTELAYAKAPRSCRKRPLPPNLRFTEAQLQRNAGRSEEH